LQILVIEAPPFVIVHNISTNGQPKNNNFKPVKFPSDPLKTGDPNVLIYGLIADFIRELQMEMHFSYTIDVANSTTSYHSLVASMAEDKRKYDMAISDILITANRLLTVQFSTPFCDNTLRVIIRKKPYSSSFSLVSFLNPFTCGVWVIIVAVAIYSSLIIYLFEYHNKETENRELGIRSTYMGMCKVLGYLIMMSDDIRLTTNASRLTIVGLYALGTILVATYTANLASFLTLNRVQPSISGIDDIKKGSFKFSRIGIVTNSAIADYYEKHISSEYYSLSNVEEIYLGLLNHTIDASIWSSQILEYAVNNHYCDQLSVVGVGFVKSPFGIVLPKDWPYKKDLDVHIMDMRGSEKLEIFEKRWLEHQTCSSSSGKTGQTKDSNNDKFSVDAMGGLFLLYFILTVIAFIYHLWDCRVAIKDRFCQAIHSFKLYNRTTEQQVSH
jgi:ionotropic glutamate receptor